METTIPIAIAGLLLLATVTYIVAETRLTYAAFAGAAVLAFLDGEAIVDGILLTVLFSPSLIFLVPAARRLKARAAASHAEGGAARAPEPPKAKSPPASSDASPGTASNDPTAPVAAKPQASDREAEAQQRAEARNRAMIERMEADPVSAVLRRQVPVRFNEEPRSWLGGLPMMPAGVPWPSGGPGRHHLNFMAQIACADLPDRLWRGQGPREGWLLLFVDASDMDGTKEEQARILHIDTLGPERQPPADLPPVHNKIVDGPDYWQPQEDVPSVWRKWPVDIVEQYQELEGGQVISFVERDFAPRPTTSEELYGIKQIETLPRLDASISPPRTWGAASDYLSMLMIWAAEQAGKAPGDPTASLRDADGWMARLIAETKAAETEIASEIARSAAKAEAAEELQLRRVHEARIRKLEKQILLEQETLARLEAYASGDGEEKLEEDIAATAAELPSWWASLATPLRTMRDAFSAQPREAELPEAVWKEVQGVLCENMHTSVIRTDARGHDKAKAIRWDIISPGTLKPWGGPMLREHYLDLYTTSPETRVLIPDVAFRKVEEIARAISWDKPHRMGGLADPLQDDIGPESPPLLFQIASDTGMNWMWGDAGAIYIKTTDYELGTRRFKGGLRMECH